MANHRSDNENDLGLDHVARMWKAEMDRRQLFLRAAAAGAVAPAFAAGLRARGVSAAQDVPQDQLVTVSTEQTATWVRNFNPFFGEGTSRMPVQAGIYEPMIIYNTAKGEIVPWLATEYAFNEDNSVLTFTLNEGVTWSDGTPFTANDVAFTFNLLKENDGLPGTGGVRTVLPLLSEITAVDEKTVSFTFSQVFTPGLYDIGHQPIVAEHIWKDVEDPVIFTNENPIGTGPFTVVARFEDQYWELHKNPTYWQEGLPHIQGFRFPAYPSNDAANLATLNGDNDWAGNFIPDIENIFVAKDPEHNHYWFPAVGAVVHLYLNTTRAPFDNPDVRKAISMSIDRDLIAEVPMYGYTHPADATGMGDAFTAWKSEEAVAGADWVTLNVEKANELLDAAGLTLDGDVRRLSDETEMVYDLNVVSGWSDWVQSCEIMAKGLEEIGIKATVKTYDFAAWFDRVQKGDFDLSIGWGTQGPTPFNGYRGVMSSKTARPVGQIGTENWHRYASAEADALLDRFAASSDEAELKEIVVELQRIYATEAPAIPLFPGPVWGEYNSTRFVDWPDADNPYSLLPTWQIPDRLIVITTIKPRTA